MGTAQQGAVPPIPPEVFTSTTRRFRAGLKGGALRVAFAGRTSTDDKQDATLSIPRQLANSRASLPPRGMIVAHFYDVESGRMDLKDRGRGKAHEAMSIPVPRDGGIQDLLEEAAREDRRFDAVICESIERLARRSYISSQIEHRLEQLGVLLLASDEPIMENGKKATQILTRRVKQGVAEWYVLELLEKSWGGFETHTEQGFNVGSPPYGYMPLKVPHPVPAKRAEGATKHRLTPDPLRGPTVTWIFELRVHRRLGYEAIADVLNLQPDRFPPPRPVDPRRAVGKWTGGSVRGVLTNPKYCGFMVWNRRGTKAGGRLKPPEEWVWSSQPTHEPLVSVDTFIAAQKIAGHRVRSRQRSGINQAHPQAARSYRLRSYVRCALCGRRMFGKTRREVGYFACQPPKGKCEASHPKSVWVREAYLMEAVLGFFTDRVFSPARSRALFAAIPDADTAALREHEQAVSSLERRQEELNERRDRLLGQLEFVDDPASRLAGDIRERAERLYTEKEEIDRQLRELRERPPVRVAPEMLDAIPVQAVELDKVPEEVLRRLFEAFRLELTYDKWANHVHIRVTLAAESLDESVRAAQRVADPGEGSEMKRWEPSKSVPICEVPPAGFEPAHTAPEAVALSPELRGLACVNNCSRGAPPFVHPSPPRPARPGDDRDPVVPCRPAAVVSRP